MGQVRRRDALYAMRSRASGADWPDKNSDHPRSTPALRGLDAARIQLLGQTAMRPAGQLVEHRAQRLGALQRLRLQLAARG